MSKLWNDNSLNLNFNHDPIKTQHILSRYLSHKRLYHGLHHISFLKKAHLILSDISQNTMFEGKETMVDEFIMYHDSILEPEMTGNEEASAELWKNMNGGSKDSWQYTTILATANHNAPRTVVNELDELRDWCVGLDLLPLAAPWERFAFNNKLIRLEYSHVSDEQWNNGRTSFVKHMAQGVIYKNSLLYNLFEKAAHANLERLLTEGV